MERTAQAGAAQVRVRLAATPVSVSVVRRMVDEVLRRWGQHGLVDDVALCVTELSTNSALHGASNFEVEVALTDDAISICVLDDGSTPADVIASRADTAGQEIDHAAEHVTEEPGMTGRGLFIVATLATEWGIDDTDEGVRIWATFRRPAIPAARTSVEDGVYADRDHDDRVHDDRVHDDRAHEPRVTTHVPEPRSGAAMTGRFVAVHLQGCPSDLMVAHDENFADIVRELQVMGAGELEPGLRTALESIAAVVQRNVVTWDAARLSARDAVRGGRPRVDLTVLVPSTVREGVARLRDAVSRAEEHSREGRLMTMPVGPAVRTLRDWLQDQLVGQAALGRPPTPYAEWLASRDAAPHAP